MTAERWERLQEVFGAAAELKGVERAALIEARCGGDARRS